MPALSGDVTATRESAQSRVSQSEMQLLALLGRFSKTESGQVSSSCVSEVATFPQFMAPLESQEFFTQLLGQGRPGGSVTGAWGS